jgi:methylmalonic aciduria homocystinuria type C protein
MNALVAGLARRCAEGGFDLCAATTAADYNVRVPDELRMADWGRPRALVVVIGNTRALWPAFAAALATDPELAADRHPLDRYAASTITSAVEATRGGVRAAVYFAPEPPPRRVALARLAEAAGLATIAPCQLAIHPVYGPWFALRAAVVLDVDGPPPTPPPARPCDCARGCQPALDRALAAGSPTTGSELRAQWELWVAVRDACPVGRDHRYSDEQVRYHYTGDRAALPRRSA